MSGNSIFQPRISVIFVENHLVVHHMSEGDNVRVRVISDSSPWEGANNAVPNLEDAYLWLVKEKRDSGSVKQINDKQMNISNLYNYYQPCSKNDRL